jgi:hypothetical protein
MLRPSNRSLSLLTLGFAALLASPALAVTVVNFEGPNDFANNFSTIPAIAGTNATPIGQGVANSNGFAQQLQTGTGAGGVALLNGVYTASSTPEVFSADFAVAVGNASVGFLVVDAANPDNNLLALVNVDRTGTLDRIRGFRDGVYYALTSAGTGGSVFDSGDPATLNVGINVSTDATPAFGTLTFRYAVVAGAPQLSIQYGATTTTITGFAAADSITNYQLGLRLFDGRTVVPNEPSTLTPAKFDNFTFTPIPEPAVLGSILAGGLLMLRRKAK